MGHRARKCLVVIATVVIIAAGMAVVSPNSAYAEKVVLSCTARGSSHTARMTFDYYPGECRLYWREVEKTLTLDICKPPVLKAQRPYAGKTDSFLLLNLATGVFVSRFGGVDDRGRCETAQAGE